MKITTEKFNTLVSEAIDSLPEYFHEKINNLAFFVEDFPTKEQLGKVGRKGRHELLGLFEGYIQSSRKNFGVVLPDKITIFQIPMMENCQSEEEIKEKIAKVVRHEIAHHFGSDEDGARKAEKRLSL